MHVTDFQGFLVKVLGRNYVLFAAVFKMQCNTHILQAQTNLVPLLSMSTALSRVLSMINEHVSSGGLVAEFHGIGQWLHHNVINVHSNFGWPRPLPKIRNMCCSKMQSAILCPRWHLSDGPVTLRKHVTHKLEWNLNPSYLRRHLLSMESSLQIEIRLK